MRIEPHQAPSACPSRHQRARNVVVLGRGVETQHGSFGDADVVARHDASQQRARRQAWPVDDDTLAGSTYLVELKYIGRDLPPGSLTMRISAEAVSAKDAVTNTDASAPANTDCNVMNTLPD
jgi:hypothetical protein